MSQLLFLWKNVTSVLLNKHYVVRQVIISCKTHLWKPVRQWTQKNPSSSHILTESYSVQKHSTVGIAGAGAELLCYNGNTGCWFEKPQEWTVCGTAKKYSSRGRSLKRMPSIRRRGKAASLCLLWVASWLKTELFKWTFFHLLAHLISPAAIRTW